MLVMVAHYLYDVYHGWLFRLAFLQYNLAAAAPHHCVPSTLCSCPFGISLRWQISWPAFGKRLLYVCFYSAVKTTHLDRHIFIHKWSIGSTTGMFWSKTSCQQLLEIVQRWWSGFTLSHIEKSCRIIISPHVVLRGQLFQVQRWIMTSC